MLYYLFQDFQTKKFKKSEILFRLIFDRGCSAVFLYRLSSWCWKHKLTPLALLFKQLNILLNSCDIAYQADIGSGFRILHGLGIVIAESKIGNNFSIFQHVTVGKNGKTESDGRETPIIGNNVALYVGSVVLGPIIIGDNVDIGANAVVLNDVPSFSTAVGIPARIIIKEQTNLIV